MSDTISDWARKAAMTLRPEYSDEWWEIVAKKQGRYLSVYLAASSARDQIEHVFQKLLDSATAELRTKLLYAEDAAEKGEAARLAAAGMEDEIAELRAQLEKETGKLVSLLDVCREEGWNGVENSKFADTFIRVLISELRAQVETLTALTEIPHDYCLSCGGIGGHEEGCMGTTGLIALASKVETLTKERNEAQNSDAQATNELELVIIQRDAALAKEHKAVSMLDEWKKDAELEKLRAEVARLTREVAMQRDTQ